MSAAAAAASVACHCSTSSLSSTGAALPTSGASSCSSPSRPAGLYRENALCLRGSKRGLIASSRRGSLLQLSSRRSGRSSVRPRQAISMDAEFVPADTSSASTSPSPADAAHRTTVGGLNGEQPETVGRTYGVAAGTPEPLGPSLGADGRGVNFALFSEHASFVTLCILEDPRSNEPTKEYNLDPSTHRTGNVWHICLEGMPLRGLRYSYRVGGEGGWDKGHRWDPSALLLDPYAPLVEGRRVFNEGGIQPFFGTFALDEEPFDWGANYSRPSIEEKDTVVYEMNVRAFTADSSSGLPKELRGSYLGVKEKVGYLKELGVNCVELLPVHEFDELEFQRRPNPRDHLVNTWGYSTINFFAPMTRYASGGKGPLAAAREFKEMVKALHDEGILVILDVVYNHTNESDDKFPFLTSFRGIDNAVYYMVDFNSYVQLRNYAGCGNTFNCNHPVVKQLILDSLRHWVTEYHVDGFRFDLASVLCRGTDGAPLTSPPVLEAIAKDPILSKVKLIAEPWDCGGLYQVGSFPNWEKFAEWNGRYRDDVRRFLKGTPGHKSPFATRLAGSADLYAASNRKPYHSINFVIAHDGFTLRDLVSYNFKHNEANGEGGLDGSNDNESWNCGVEGVTNDQGIIGLRWRQMKNFMVALIVSQGTPMVLMGDEYGHTREGNNNSYGHDNRLNHFQWDELESLKAGFFRFYSGLIKFRVEHPLLGRNAFLSNSEITWHEDRWDDWQSRFLAFSLHEGHHGCGDLYVAFNAHHFWVEALLPPCPNNNKRWVRLVDTNLPSPDDFIPEGVTGLGATYNIAPYSSILLVAR
eukprot:jgi/Chlat1/6939/Chrsp52S06606